MTPAELDAALSQEDGDITRIQIDLTGPNQFRWTLFDGERKIFVGEGDRCEVHSMILCSEMLCNVMLGLPVRSGIRPSPSLN
jgi:hypothetical protein